MNSNIKSQLDRLKAENKRPIVIRSPGRANIIGEHIDYYGGTVLPFAIPQAMYFIISKRDDDVAFIKALDIKKEVILPLDKFECQESWLIYFRNILKILENRQYVFSGFDLVFTSEIPIGGGVSSSSALCCGFIKSLSALFKFEISDKEIIKLASEAEYGMGLKGGLMDQNAIVYGQNAHILKLDCDSGTLEQMPFNLGKHQMILFDTNVKHKLIDTEYNLRREQGEKALKRINEQTKRVFNFRTITLEALEFLKDDPILKKRIKHVITEIQRVNQAIMAIECNNFKLLGRLIKESHESLQNDYEVSCEQLDFVAAYLNAQDDVLGARMMGGGFGGNVLALFKEAPNQRLVDKLKKEYEKIYKLSLKTLSIWPSEGLHMVEID